MPIRSVGGGWSSPAEAVTATAKTVSTYDSGKTFTNRGAGAGVTLTLPAPSPGLAGWSIRAFRHAAQSLIVAGAANGDLVISADAAANSVTIATVGHGVEVWCDGTQHYVTLLPGAAATIISGATVAT